MGYTRGATRKEINRTFDFYNIASGRKRTPDDLGYVQDKLRLESMPLTPDEYEKAAKRAAARRGL